MGEYTAMIELGEVGEIPGHTQNALELFLILKGRVLFTLDGNSYSMGENDIVLCNSDQVHSAVGEGPNIALRLEIQDQFLYQELGRSNFRFHCVCCGRHDSDRQVNGYEKLKQMLTRDSVIKIALNNGFSNVSSFNRLFQQTYGQSPAKYRSQRQVSTRRQAPANELNKVFQIESDLISYLGRFDVRNKGGSGELTEIRINTRTKSTESVPHVEKIIRVGLMGELLKVEVQNQLRQLKENLDISAVHMQCVFGDGMTDYPSRVYTEYAYMQVMEFLLDLGVQPIFSFSVGDLLQGEKGIDEITALLCLACVRFASADRESWRFEVTHPEHALPEVRYASYQSLRKAVRSVMPKASVGLQLIRRGTWDRSCGQEYVKLFKELSDERPDFLSLCLQLPTDNRFGQEGDYSRYQACTIRQIDQMREQFGTAGLDLPEILLMDWTTLSSRSEGASKTFFRSALIVDEIVRFAPCVKGMAFWLNYWVEEAALGKRETDSLAVYLLYQFKLPVYFTLRLLELLYPEIICRTENILVTRSKEGDLAILVYNPCYFSPSLAADQSYTKEKRRSYRLQLQEIYGKFIVELYHMDNHKTAFYGQWASMGFPTVEDRSGTEYLERAVNLVYSVLEEQPEGECSLSVTLDYNETAVFRLRKH